MRGPVGLTGGDALAGKSNKKTQGVIGVQGTR